MSGAPDNIAECFNWLREQKKSISDIERECYFAEWLGSTTLSDYRERLERGKGKLSNKLGRPL